MPDRTESGALWDLAKELTALSTHPETKTSPERAKGLAYAAKRAKEVAMLVAPFHPKKFS